MALALIAAIASMWITISAALPLSFRGQVGKAQGPLPCFSPTALSSRRPLPSIGSR
jgi:hypothetical protein